MTYSRLERLRRRWLLGGGALAGLLLGWTDTGPLAAQSPQNAGQAPAANRALETSFAQRLYFNKNIIHLPIQLQEQARPQTNEIQLYVKEQPSAPWKLRDSARPEQKSFTFRAPHDGEYAFTMVTIDKQGHRTPADLRTESPQLVIVIDTQMPQVEVTYMGKSPEGQLIQFLARDSNLDIAKVRFYFQGGDKQFRQIDALANRPGVFCVPDQAVFTGIVRAAAGDLAGNVTTREFHINQLPTGSLAKVAVQEPTPSPPVLAPVASATKNPPNTLPESVYEPLRGMGSEPPNLPALQETPDPTPTQPARRTDTRPDGSEGPRFVDLPTPHTVNKLVQTNAAETPIPLAPPIAGRKEGPKRQLVNQNKVFLDYQIENPSQSGAAKVELWLTRDQGKTWAKHAEESQAKSSIEVHLPEDGLYGISLVAVNNRGKSVPPTAGDAPDWLIEVDTTKPTTQITNLQTVQENGTTVVLVGWKAQDANLGEGPVELSYSATVQGPWLPIAKGLGHEGQHRWTPPALLGAQGFVRIVARDKAGNSSIACTLDPISLEDTTSPRAVIRGVRTETGSATDGK